MNRIPSAPRSHRFAVAVTVVLLAAWPAKSVDAEALQTCGVIDIHEIGWSRLDEIRNTEDEAWWIELGGELLYCGSDIAVASIAAQNPILISYEGLDLEQLRIAQGFHQSQLADPGLQVIAKGGGVALVHILDPKILEEVEASGHRVLQPVVANSRVVRQAANKEPRGRTYFAPEVQGFVDLVDGDRWFADVESLASFNRYTHNSGILDARDWLVAEFQSLPGLQVETPSFLVGNTTAYNVIATLAGQTRPEEWYIIGGHYDSISPTPQVAAPGAEDNGSGCAGVLELARIFTAHPPEATTMFICYSGEELGLKGSKDHVDDLTDADDLDKVQFMLNLDMIGYTSDEDLDCKLETDPFAMSWFDIFEDAAAEFTTLRILTDQSACCSDHEPYLDDGVPALLTIENDWSEYPHYHQVTDLPEHLTIAMAEEILKMNVAAMAELIGAPEPPIFTDGFESGDTRDWTWTLP